MMRNEMTKCMYASTKAANIRNKAILLSIHSPATEDGFPESWGWKGFVPKDGCFHKYGDFGFASEQEALGAGWDAMNKVVS